MIFSVQTARLQRALRNQFKFIFVDAPYETTPGPGVLPIFKGCGPYYRWIVREGEDDRKIRNTLYHRVEEPDAGGIVGVLGFSQGCRMAAGLLQDQQDGCESIPAGFKFGVFVCGAYPPIRLSKKFSLSIPSGADMTEEANDELITIPSIHVHGLQDQWLENARTLAGYFDKSTSQVMEFDMDHQMPAVQANTDKLAQAILRAHEETRIEPKKPAMNRALSDISELSDDGDTRLEANLARTVI